LTKGAVVITDPRTARILVDPMRREMLRLLAERAMTENELADALGLSNPSVGHHLKILKDAGLIRISRREVEAHGILQKFYETSALAYFVDGRRMPLEVERYFMPVGLERARGILAAFSVMQDESRSIGTRELEEFARILSASVIDTAAKHSKAMRKGREAVIGGIYRDALVRVLAEPDRLSENLRLLFASRKA
jgi:DNA-binding transcriptional ArsR family regulator